jgi:hypothetical protein
VFGDQQSVSNSGSSFFNAIYERKFQDFLKKVAKASFFPKFCSFEEKHLKLYSKYWLHIVINENYFNKKIF